MTDAPPAGSPPPPGATQPPPGATQPPPGATPPAGSPPPAAWHEGLAPEDLVLVESKGWKGKPLGEVIAGYRNLEKVVGFDKVPLPPKDDKGNRDFSKIDYAQLGRPEKPDAYEIKHLEGRQPTEGDIAFQNVMRGAFHKAGLNPFQATVLNEAYNAVAAEAFKGEETRVAQSQQQAVAALQQEWGSGYRAKMELANRTVKAVLGKDLATAQELKLADGTFVFDHPLLAKAFATVGGQFGEDTEMGSVVRGHGSGPVTPAEAKAELAALERPGSDTMKILQDKMHPEYKAMNEKRDRLYAIVYPGEVPADG